MDFIKNTTLFFIGIALVLLGVFVIVFDYPQIQFFEDMGDESFYLLDQETKNIFERLVIELYVGVGITSLGIFTIILCFFKNSNRNAN